MGCKKEGEREREKEGGRERNGERTANFADEGLTEEKEREAAGIEIGHREGSSAMETFSLVVERFLRRTNTVEWRGGREGGE